jgi:hypothetical protein
MSSLRSGNVSFELIGKERNPLIIVDNFYPNPLKLVEFAAHADNFIQDKSDFYPGVRLGSPEYYGNFVVSYISQNLLPTMHLSKNSQFKSTLCALSIANQSPDTLLPIQRIPHFDTVDQNQWAFLHYLCKETHGGTGFFRHRCSGFESITASRRKKYQRLLEDEATTKGLPDKQYVAGSSQLFEMYHEVKVCFNRAIFYPSHLLHSGLVSDWQATDIPSSRLTANTFVKFDSPNAN